MQGTPACDLASSCMIQQKARSLSVLPTGRKLPYRRGAKVFQVAVVGKYPVRVPELTHKRVAVFKRHTAMGCLADSGNDVAAFNGIAAYQLGHGRGAGWLVIDKTAQTLVTAITTIFKKSDPPTVGVLAGVAAALREAAAAGGACVLEWAISTGLRDGVAASR